MIYLQGYGGLLLSVTGNATSALQSQWTRVLWPIVATMALLSIIQTARRIHKVAVTFTEEILISRELAIHTGYRKGQMDRASAESLRQALDKETIWYRSLASAFDLLRTEGVAVILTLGFLCLGFSGLITDGAEKDISENQYLSLLTAAAIVSIIPELSIAMAFRRLAGILTFDWPKDTPGQSSHTEKITIISQQSGKAEEVELLNPDFHEASQTTTETTPIHSEPEQVASFEPSGKIRQTILSPATDKPRYANMDDYYADLCKTIRETGRIFILAAEEVTNLPVTVAVNTALRLAKDGETVLMIDAEPGRNAIAEVFDLQESARESRAEASCIENLSVWLGREFVEGRLDNLANLALNYQRILIYAPQIRMLSAGVDLAKLADQVILIGPVEQQNTLKEIQEHLARTTTIFVSPAEIV
jgi:hypothetical protein